MIVIGIAGGVASGKSLVSEQLRDFGATILDADHAGHEVLLESAVIEALAARWGDRVLDSGGQMSRSKIADIVFAPAPNGPRELEFLESISHPRIERRLQDQAIQMEREGKVKAVVLDAAVMFKAGWDRLCDKIIFVDAPRDVRLTRAKTRGWSEAEFTARESRQESLDLKRGRSHIIIDNSGEAGATIEQLKHFWQSLGFSIDENSGNSN
ncbi:MAG: dephospho-CoA kinase [Planctomycetes bacterium]|nr:dephospho-CoA kinase [Planctomycetota bacterium]